MTVTPWCTDRACKHFGTSINPDTGEAGCRAFPNGIPNDILLGVAPHTKKWAGQTGDFVYEADEAALAAMEE
jgi:hypothetical protein